MTRVQRTQSTVLTSLVAVAISALVAGCGFGGDTTLNRARKALAAGDAERARDVLSQADAYPADLSRGLVLAVDLAGKPGDDWVATTRLILDAVNATYRQSRSDERTAIHSYVSARQLRRTRAAAEAADFAVERLAGWLASADPGALLSAPAAAVDVSLLATRSLNTAVAARADDILTTLGPAAIPPLIAALSHDAPSARAAAVRRLSRLGTDEALTALLPLIDAETEFEPLYELPMALGRFPLADAAAPLMAMLALRDDSSHATPSGPARAEAMAQLGRVLRAVPEARGVGIPVVIAGLTDEHDYVRSRAASILTDLRRDAVGPLLALLAAGWRDEPLPVLSLLQPSVEVEARVSLFGAASTALLALSEPTVMTADERETFVTALRDALSDETRRSVAVEALSALGSDGAATLYPLLDSHDASVRALAAETLAGMGEDASADPIVARITRETEAEPLTAMVAALGALDPGAVVAAADALVAAADGRPDVLEAVATALADALEGGADAAPVADAVDALLVTATADSAREGLRRAAIRALALLAPDGIELTMRDIMLSEHAAPLIRKSAAAALTSMGPRADVALGAMEEILHIRREDPDAFLKRLRKRHGSEASLNAAWGQLGWQTGFGNFREVKVIPSVLRSEVVRAVHTLRGSDADDLLAEVLRDDQSASVRAVAASKLADASTHVDALLRALRKDKSGSVRAACAVALGQMGDARAERALLRVVERDDYEQARRQAAIAVGSLGGANAAKALAALLIADGKDEDDQLTDALVGDIADALAAIGEAGTPHVLPGLQHASADVRHAAVRALAPNPSPEARTALRAVLTDDPSARVRKAAAGALAAREDLDVLAAIVDDAGEWGEVRAAAALALARVGRAAVAPTLVGRLDDPIPHVRAACATALGELHGADAAGPLARAAENTSELSSVRVAAIQALGAIDDAGEPALLRLAAVETGAVREAAVTALAGIESTAAAEALAGIAASPAEPRALRDIAAGD